MAILLDHLIVPSHNPVASARYLADLLESYASSACLAGMAHSYTSHGVGRSPVGARPARADGDWQSMSATDI